MHRDRRGIQSCKSPDEARFCCGFSTFACHFQQAVMVRWNSRSKETKPMPVDCSNAGLIMARIICSTRINISAQLLWVACFKLRSILPN